MASNYGHNFGFLRSSEEVRVAEGRYRVQKGVAWMLGVAVEPHPDPSALPVANRVDNAMRVAAANAAPVTGYCGLLLQELEMFRSIYDSEVNLMDSFMYGVAKPGQLGIITNGAGTKVWFRNTLAQDRADGRSIPAKTMFTTAGVALGVELAWNTDRWAAVNGTTLTNAHMKVTAYTPPTTNHGGYVEAVLLA